MKHKEIYDALAPLSIDVEFQHYEGNNDKYIIFNVYDKLKTDHQDDKYSKIITYIQMSYIYKNEVDIEIADEIEELMEQAGFIFDGVRDDYINGKYRKQFEFIHIERL